MDNLKFGMDAVRDVIVEGTICYTGRSAARRNSLLKLLVHPSSVNVRVKDPEISML
jgi:hypothetical protein